MKINECPDLSRSKTKTLGTCYCKDTYYIYSDPAFIWNLISYREEAWFFSFHFYVLPRGMRRFMLDISYFYFMGRKKVFFGSLSFCYHLYVWLSWCYTNMLGIFITQWHRARDNLAKKFGVKLNLVNYDFSSGAFFSRKTLLFFCSFPKVIPEEKLVLFFISLSLLCETNFKKVADETNLKIAFPICHLFSKRSFFGWVPLQLMQ